MSDTDWDAFTRAVEDGAVLVLNPKVYDAMMLAAGGSPERRTFLMQHARTSDHVPEDRAFAVFTHQEEIELGQ